MVGLKVRSPLFVSIFSPRFIRSGVRALFRKVASLKAFVTSLFLELVLGQLLHVLACDHAESFFAHAGLVIFEHLFVNVTS